MCRICVPVIIWIAVISLTGAGGTEEPGRPWKERDPIVAEGTLDKKVTKENCQILYLKNTSIISEPDCSEADRTSYENTRIIVYLKENSSLKIGNRVRVSGICEYPSPPANPGGFDGKSYYRSIGVSLLLRKAAVLAKTSDTDPVQEALYQFREKGKGLLERLCEPQEAGVLEALLLGSRENLDEEIKELYQTTGTIHVLSISGLHMSFLGMACYRFLRRRRRSFLFSSILSLSILLLYGMLTGFPVSAVRALVMFGVYLGAQILGRTYDCLTAVPVTAAVMLLKNPYLIRQSSFLLSFSAILGVYASVLWNRKPLKKTAFGAGLMVYLMMLPFTMYFYYQIPLWSVFLNLLVVPSMSAIMTAGSLGLLTGSISLSLGKFVLGGVHYLLQGTFLLERLVSGLPGAVWITGRPALWQMGIYYVLLAGSLVFFQKREKIDLIKRAFGIILGIGILFYRGDPGWSAAFLDVGQGDGICIRTGVECAWMVDGGSSTKYLPWETILEPYLKYCGISEIEGWMLSHYDGDHVNGLLEFLDSCSTGSEGKGKGGIRVRQIYLPEGEENEPLKEKILQGALRAGIPVRFCRRGDSMKEGDMTFQVLSPEKNAEYEDGNAASMTVKVTYGGFSMLLMGDLQGSGEEMVTELLKEVRGADLIKIAHHGSRYSSSDDFLDAAGAEAAVISSGKENRYGHPHQELLQRLEHHQMKIYRTDQQGAVIISVGKNYQRRVVLWNGNCQ